MRGTPLEEGRRWLEQAEVDLGWAEHLSDEGAYHIACFLAQQVANSVARVCAEAARADSSFDEGCARWSALDAFYVPTRYPNSVPDSIPARVFTSGAAEEAAHQAGEVVLAVRERLSGGTAGGP